MKKLVSTLLVAALAVAMVVPVAASSSVSTSSKASEASATQVTSTGEWISYQSSGTPQGINNAYLANLASQNKIGGAAATAINANESKKLYDFAKTAIGKNCYMLTAFQATGIAAGLVRIENPSLKAGTNLTVLVRTATGIVAVPAVVSDGAITVNMPEGAVSAAIFYNAVAPW